MHGDAYNFFSGIGNDLPIYLLGFLPFMLAWYKKNKCHWPRCHRLGHHPYKHYHYCGRHHPVENGTLQS